MLLFTRMIIGPVKGIERMINQLGAGKSLDDAALFTGPRELRSVGKRIIWLSERRRGWSRSGINFFAICRMS